MALSRVLARDLVSTRCYETYDSIIPKSACTLMQQRSGEQLFEKGSARPDISTQMFFGCKYRLRGGCFHCAKSWALRTSDLMTKNITAAFMLILAADGFGIHRGEV